MANVEVIDLTSSPQGTPNPRLNGDQHSNGKPEQASPLNRRARRALEQKNSQPTPIVISDDEAPQPGPSKSKHSKSGTPPQVSAAEEGEVLDSKPTSKSRKRKKRRNGEKEGQDGSRAKAVAAGSRDDGVSPFFCLDVGPVSVAIADQPILPSTSNAVASSSSIRLDDGLILPSHVSVTTRDEEEALAQLPPISTANSDDEDYIRYIDYEDTTKGAVRYFDLEEESAKQSRLVCKHCGAEGDHKTSRCTVVICLTCGARNEHTTRGCPISKTCFNCGLKGHINRDCPNRTGMRSMGRDMGCDRCGSTNHQVRECPTVWRIYEYVNDEEHEDILRSRKEKEGLAFGEGGEGYVGEDEWCYNCGLDGHLGDACRASRRHDVPSEPSAFSVYNIMAGPFAEADQPRGDNRRRKPREWERGYAFDDGYGASLASNVGKQGRRKERDRMREEMRRQELEDDPDDWFNRPKSARPPPSKGKGKEDDRRQSDSRNRDRDRDRDRPPGLPKRPARTPPPSLLTRLDMKGQDTNGLPERPRQDRHRDRSPKRSHKPHQDERDRRRDHNRRDTVDDMVAGRMGQGRGNDDRNSSHHKGGGSSQRYFGSYNR